MTERSPRVFAVVPAAGLSRRMGQPKLLLPVGGSSVIARLLLVLDRPDITETFVVIRGNDTSLAGEVLRSTATLVSLPEGSPDMRTSVERALATIRGRYAPTGQDAWLLAPADHPMLDARILDALLTHWNSTKCRILVPTFRGQRGHPTLFRWDLSEKISDLPLHTGINRLLADHNSDVTELAVDSRAVLADLDTPDEYNDLLHLYSKP